MSISFMKFNLWGEMPWAQISSQFVPLHKSIHMFHPSNSLQTPCLHSPNIPGSWSTIQVTGVCLYYFPGHFFLHVNLMTWNACSSTHWEDFPAPLSFRAYSEWDCNLAAVHFWLPPMYWANPSIKWGLRIFLPHQLVTGKSLSSR